MRRIHDETDNRSPLSRGAKEAQARQIGHALGGVLSEPGIMLENLRATDLLDVINRGGESDGAGDVGRASLKTVGRLFIGALFQSDADDHLSAPVPRRHRIQEASP